MSIVNSNLYVYVGHERSAKVSVYTHTLTQTHKLNMKSETMYIYDHKYQMSNGFDEKLR